MDYSIYEETIPGQPRILLHGLFSKQGRDWSFSDELSMGPKSLNPLLNSEVNEQAEEFSEFSGLNQIRRDNSCREHFERQAVEDGFSNNDTIVYDKFSLKKAGSYILGFSNCRFPSIVVDKSFAWAAWEENGDIMLASICKEDSEQNVFYVDKGKSDSYNPIVVEASGDIWIIYISNKTNYYSLYAKYYDGFKLSNKILLSDKIPLDVITPAVAVSNEGKIIILWSQWQANRRELKYRFITNKQLSDIYSVKIEDSGAIRPSAWFPSVVFDCNSQPWGVWNQHYPATLGVYGGNLTDVVFDITESKHINDFSNCGGYPVITLDDTGQIWVFWESFMWNTLQGTPQKILARYYNPKSKKWSAKQSISLEKQTFFNQTPKAVSKDGITWVVWSGKKDENDLWGVYIACFTNGTWHKPVKISSAAEVARSPSISAGPNSIWITWHTGIGESMATKVLRYDISYETPTN